MEQAIYGFGALTGVPYSGVTCVLLKYTVLLALGTFLLAFWHVSRKNCKICPKMTVLGEKRVVFPRYHVSDTTQKGTGRECAPAINRNREYQQKKPHDVAANTQKHPWIFF